MQDVYYGMDWKELASSNIHK